MTKFNYKKWVTENKHGKILKESMYGDDATFGLAAKGLASKSDPSDIWNNYNIKQRKIIIDQSDLENDPIEQEALAKLSYDDLMKKLPKEDGYKMDQIILDGLTDDEMKRTSEALNEELDANKIKDSLKNLAKEKDIPGFGPTTTVDGDVRSDLVGIILPSLEKANAPEELIKNLEILSNKYNTDQGVSLAQQPDEVKNAITYLTGDKAQKSVDQIGDVAGGYADALKPGTEKIYTADAFPDGLKDSDFYKKSVKDGWKFITKNSLTPDQEKIAKSLPTKSDGTPLKEMKVTDKDGNDVTSDIIKQLEKSLEKSGYEITKEETKKEDDPREDPDYDMDQHYMDYDLPEGKLKSLAEALGYLNEIDGMEDSDDEDLTFEPEDGVVDEISLDDVEFTFEKLKSFFPKFYQKVKFTRTQPNGEEGPYYSDSISFPKLDDSTMEISDESALETYKDYMKSRGFGNVEMEFNDEAKNQNSRVFIHSDDFNDERDAFIRGKMKALNR